VRCGNQTKLESFRLSTWLRSSTIVGAELASVKHFVEIREDLMIICFDCVSSDLQEDRKTLCKCSLRFAFRVERTRGRVGGGGDTMKISLPLRPRYCSLFSWQ
jgi:hypothetical protein